MARKINLTAGFSFIKHIYAQTDTLAKVSA